MASGIRINIETHGDFAYGQTAVPLQIEVADHKLKPVKTQLTYTNDRPAFDLEPGTYAVTASTPSGSQVQRVVEVRQGETRDVTLPLYDISPREDYEWAYMTQKRTPQSIQDKSLREHELTDAWVRLWQGHGNSHELVVSAYESYKTPNGRFIQIDSMPQGVNCLQVGGPEVPWKCVAVPPLTTCKVLIQVSPKHSKHPLEVTVASDNMALESLLTLLQRGEIKMASEIEQDQARLAEEMVFYKRKDPMAAAVGGYFLLRIKDYARLHDWANNLANWFPWMPDGAIIHAWQLIAQVRQMTGAKETGLDQAKERLIEAVARGYPIYSEGLRLLRDGLILFDQRAEGKDSEIHAALNQAGAYYSAADLSNSTTTFLGETPYNPSPRPVTGVPENQTGLKYIFE